MKKLLIYIPLILLPACASKKPVIVHMPPVVTGNALSTADMESVRYSENLKAYPVGRYVDPSDGFVMHEAHTIYRVETTAKWNLHPDVYPYAPGNLPGGPVVGIIDPAHSDSPVTPEVVAEIDRQKAATQALIAQGQRMSQVVSQLSKVLPATSQVAEDNAQLKAQALATERRLELLEDQVRKQQTETEFTPPVAPSVKGTNDW